MQSASGNQLVENLFTDGRHLNLSVIFVSQNLFYTGKKCRTISLNSTYIVVFKNPRDQTQIRHLACQMFPSKPKFSQAAYEEETKDPYRYLFLDFHPNSPEFAKSSWKYFPIRPIRRPVLSLSPKRHTPSLTVYKRTCVYVTKYSFAFELNDVKRLSWRM